MKTTFAGTLLLAILFATPGLARGHRIVTLAPECNVTMPCEGGYYSPVAKRLMNVPFGMPLQHYNPKRVTKQAVPTRIVSFHPKRRVVVDRTVPPADFGSYAAGRPSRYIAGRLICAVNVGAALAERGIKGTGSALALSYLHWGRSAGGPVPGAVIVSGRHGGGHVAIVSRVEGGVVYAWNATGGQNGWREIPYRHHVIDYRVPG